HRLLIQRAATFMAARFSLSARVRLHPGSCHHVETLQRHVWLGFSGTKLVDAPVILLWPGHARGADGHTRQADAVGVGVLLEEFLYRLEGHVTLDDVLAHLDGMAGAQTVGKSGTFLDLADRHVVDDGDLDAERFELAGIFIAAAALGVLVEGRRIGHSGLCGAGTDQQRCGDNQSGGK
ncbi:hypothetical protein AOG27_21075, partial [Pseudoalteromonas lipolytica]